MSSAVMEIPSWRTAIRSIPASGVGNCRVTGSAVLTVKQRSARIGRGGASGAPQASSGAPGTRMPPSVGGSNMRR